MTTAVSIIAVMYFFLLPARFEGERYAPSKVEKWVVIAGLGLTMLIMSALISGHLVMFFFSLLPIYLMLLPVRLMLKVKIYPQESVFAVLFIFVATAICLLFPLLQSQ